MGRKGIEGVKNIKEYLRKIGLDPTPLKPLPSRLKPFIAHPSPPRHSEASKAPALYKPS